MLKENPPKDDKDKEKGQRQGQRWDKEIKGQRQQG
jgi:hypothetical protein